MTEVQSDVPGIEKGKDLTYSDVIRTLSVDIATSENVFSRLAKLAIADLLRPNVKLGEVDSAKVVWATQKTVVIPIGQVYPLDNHDDLPEASWLRELVYLLEADITKTRGERKFVSLLEPVWVRVLKISENMYSFSLKQKWQVLDD
jgi:hypothetical protein